jgi:hypothetical protein
MRSALRVRGRVPNAESPIRSNRASRRSRARTSTGFLREGFREGETNSSPCREGRRGTRASETSRELVTEARERARDGERARAAARGNRVRTRLTPGAWVNEDQKASFCVTKWCLRLSRRLTLGPYVTSSVEQVEVLLLIFRRSFVRRFGLGRAGKTRAHREC